MTENKRFNIKPSAMVDDVTVIIDDEKKYSFPILDSTLNYMFCKALNELNDKNELFKRNIEDYRKLSLQFERRNNELISDNAFLEKENKELKKLLELISSAHSFTKEESVKEILRNEIKGIDTVTEYSAMAWNDYCTLSNFFKKQYGEHWDNE